MITQLGYLGIGVKDTKAWEEFGTNAMGLEVSDRLGDGTLYLRQDEYHHRFIIEPTGEDDVKYMGWMAPTIKELEEVCARLREAGVPFEDGSPEECKHRRVNQLITFKDPNGVRQEVFYGLDVLAAHPFRSSLPVSRFVTKGQGLGHIGLCCNNVDESERFYRDILGFRISDYIVGRRPNGQENKIAFFHVNPRHHSLALFGYSPQRMNHIMLQTETLDETGMVHDHIKRLGIPMTTSLGRHVNDRMVSFFMQSPSPFNIEIGWGAREVDDNTWEVQVHHTGGDVRGHIWGHEPLRPMGQGRGQPAGSRPA